MISFMSEYTWIESTRSGRPAAWERGGGYSNSGDAEIWCRRNGKPFKAYYIRRRGHLANNSHALIPVIRDESVFILADHHRQDFEIRIGLVADIVKDDVGYRVVFEPVAEYSCGEWEIHLPEIFQNIRVAILAAVSKALCYHCREPHYVEGYVITSVPQDIIEELSLST